jgi:hypothetical protein
MDDLPFDQREALRMLAGSPDGTTESILMTHGFAIGRFGARRPRDL